MRKRRLLTMLDICLIVVCAVFLHHYSLNKSYYLTDNEARLLSKTAVNNGQVSFKKGVLNYNQQDQSKDGGAEFTVSGRTNSTSQRLYRVTLATKVKQGITFTETSSNLPLKMVPLTPTGNGRYINGRMIYPSDGAINVYTLRRNGIKEDIIMSEAPGNNFSYSWRLELGDNLKAHMLPKGGVGIYSANPLLFDSNLQVGDAKSRALIDKARKSNKDTLIYVIPAPFIKDSQNNLDAKDVRFVLHDNILTLAAVNLASSDKRYPLTIDPTVIVTTTAQFRVGYDDGNIDYSTADEIKRGDISFGTLGAWDYTGNSTDNGATFSAGIIQPRDGHSSVAYNGYLYVLGGQSGSSANDCTVGSDFCNGVQYAPINANGTIGTWHYTHDNTDDGTTFVSGFAAPRAGLTSIAYNGYIYVIGGHGSGGVDCLHTPDLICDGVQYAKINSDGTVGTWHYTHDDTDDGTSYVSGFNTARYGHTSVAYNGYIYVIGGLAEATSGDCSGYCNGVQYAPINANGTIGTWHYTHDDTDDGTSYVSGFNTARYGHTSVAYNGYMYILGGQSGSSSEDCGTDCNGVQYAKINPDGTLGAWHYTHDGADDNTTFVSGFNLHRIGMTTVAYNGYLYLIGGQYGAAPSGDCGNTPSYICNGVQYAPINANGTIGTWHYTHDDTDDGTSYVSGFNTARYGHTSVAYNGYIYVIGGLAQTAANDCSGYCNGVQFSAISTGTPTFGTLSAWPTVGSGSARYGHTAIAYNGYLYELGGQDDSNNVYSDVTYAPINADGSIGTMNSTASFATARTGHTTVAYNGYMYVIGGCSTVSGNSCTSFLNDIQYAPINPDGTLGTWHYTHDDTDDGTTFTAGFNTARTWHTSVAYNGFMYVIGGEEGASDTNCKHVGATTSTFCDDIQYAPINVNGTVGSWTVNTSYFSVPRFGHTSVAYNGYLYVMGGEWAGPADTTTCKGGVTPPNNDLCNDTQYAPINGNGSVGTFITSANYFSTPRRFHASVSYNGYLYIVEGDASDNGSSSLFDIEYSRISPGGDVGSWVSTNGYDPGSGSYGLAAVAYQGRLYHLGGLFGLGINGSIEAALINVPAQVSTYEKVVDLGSSYKITNLSFNGRAVCGMQISYRVGGSSGVYGSSTDIYYGLPGISYPINQTGRYLWVQFKMDDSICGTNSQITDFTVTYNITPAPPTLSSPAAGATGVSAMPQFQFKTTDADNDYLRYKIQICSTSDCSSIVQEIDQTSSQTGWSGQDQQGGTAYSGSSALISSTLATYDYQVPALSKNTQYWWRAYAIDPGGTNTWGPASAIQTFTTGDDKPAPPVLVYPISESNGNSVFTTFKLASSEYNSDYLMYWIDICADNTCSTIIRSVCQTNTGINVPGTCTPSQTGWSGQDQQGGTAYSGNPNMPLSQLAIHNYQEPYLNKNTTYWWRAYAIDPGGSNTWSDASSISSFVTAPHETHIQGSVNIRGNVKIGP